VLGDPNQPHTYTFIPDIGEALAVLGEHSDAPGQVWHLPNDPATRTTRQLVDVICKDAGQSCTKLRVIPPLLLRAPWGFSTQPSGNSPKSVPVGATVHRGQDQDCEQTQHPRHAHRPSFGRHPRDLPAYPRRPMPVRSLAASQAPSLPPRSQPRLDEFSEGNRPTSLHSVTRPAPGADRPLSRPTWTRATPCRLGRTGRAPRPWQAGEHPGLRPGEKRPASAARSPGPRAEGAPLIHRSRTQQPEHLVVRPGRRRMVERRREVQRSK
jgi:hypothetical protein